MSKLSNERITPPAPKRPAVGTTLVKRTEFGDKLVAALMSVGTQRMAR
jgi:hypothetical protein